MREILLDFVEGTVRLKTYEILYIESLRHKIIFHTRGGEYHIYKPLKEIEKMLESSGFIRIHRSYIVNPRSMKIVKSYETILDNGTRLPISKAKYKEVKAIYRLDLSRGAVQP